MLVHDGHFLCQFKEIFIIPPNRSELFNLTSTSSWISDHNLRATTLLTVCLWVYFELWIRLLLLSFFINCLFVFDSGMSSMVDLKMVSSYYLWADSPLLHCVLVYVPVCQRTTLKCGSFFGLVNFSPALEPWSLGLYIYNGNVVGVAAPRPSAIRPTAPLPVSALGNLYC